MSHKAIYFAVALTFIIFLPPRVMSQDPNASNRTRETLAPRGIRRSSKVIGPAVQNARHALEEDTSIVAFKELKEGLSEFRQAEEFMQLKVAVIADLNRLEESRHAKPKGDTVRDGDLDYQSSGNVTVNRANGRSIRDLPAQAKSAVLPVSLIRAGSTKP